MGKTKNKKRKSHNFNPTGLPSVKEFDEEEENMGTPNRFDGKHATIQSLLEKLQSGSEENKECAACTLAIFADQEEARPHLLSHNVVKIAAPLLMDPSSLVQLNISGALRNLSVSGGHEVCELMIEQDVLTPLVALLRTFGSGHSMETTSSNNKKLCSKTELFIEATNLLWNLCESSETAVRIFNRENLLEIFLNYLSVQNYGIEVTTAVAYCLHTVTEDNSQICEQLSEPHILERLTSLMNEGGDETNHHLLRTLAVGIIVNVHSGKVTASSVTSSLTSLFSVFTRTLDKTPMDFILTLCKLLDQRKNDDLDQEKKIPDTESLDKEVQSIMKEISSLLHAKQIALEVVTNMCCSDDGNDAWEDLSSSDTSEELMDIPVDDESPFSKENVLSVPCDVHEAIASLEVIEKIKQHLQLPTEFHDQLQRYPQGKEVLKKMKTVQCRALLSVSNLAVALDVEDFGGPLELYKLWLQLAHLAFKETDAKDVEVLEASTSAMRGTLQKLAEVGACSSFQETSEEDLKLIFAIAQHSPDASVRTNVVRIAGTLGCLLLNSSFGNVHHLTKSIGQFLLEMSSKDPQVRVAAEALDAIFDLFAEDNMDSVAQEIMLVEKLRHMVPAFKSKVNQYRKEVGENYPVVMTVKTNLLRFIKYKTRPSQNGSVR